MPNVWFGFKPLFLSSTIKQNISKFQKGYSVAKDVLISRIYVDDLIAGTDTVSEAVNVSQDYHKNENESI